MTPAVLGVVAALGVVFFVLRLVVRRRLLVKYAALWLLVSVLLVIMALIPGSLSGLASLLGFAVPANLLFFAGFVLILLVTLQLSTELSGIERNVQRLAEEVALLQSRPPGAAGDIVAGPPAGGEGDAGAANDTGDGA